LIREYPLALCVTSSSNHWTPLQYAYDDDDHDDVFNPPQPERSASIISLLTDTTNVLESRDFAALAARVHGDTHTIRRLCLTPSRLAAEDVSVLLLLCFKHVTHAPVTPAVPLDLRLAHAVLCRNVWSVILPFL